MRVKQLWIYNDLEKSAAVGLLFVFHMETNLLLSRIFNKSYIETVNIQGRGECFSHQLTCRGGGLVVRGELMLILIYPLYLGTPTVVLILGFFTLVISPIYQNRPDC